MICIVNNNICPRIWLMKCIFDFGNCHEKYGENTSIQKYLLVKMYEFIYGFVDEKSNLE